MMQILEHLRSFDGRKLDKTSPAYILPLGGFVVTYRWLYSVCVPAPTMPTNQYMSFKLSCVHLLAVRCLQWSHLHVRRCSASSQGTAYTPTYMLPCAVQAVYTAFIVPIGEGCQKSLQCLFHQLRKQCAKLKTAAHYLSVTGASLSVGVGFDTSETEFNW